MPTPESKDPFELLRADNVAPRQPDSFFSALAAEAADSTTPQARPGRARRVALGRIGAVIASATLIVSGGAMASAMIFFNDADVPPSGRVPDDAPEVTESPADPTAEPTSPLSSEQPGSDDPESGGQSAGGPGTSEDRQPQQGGPSGQGTDTAPGQTGVHPPQGDGDGNGNGQGDDHRPSGNNGQGLGPSPQANEHAHDNAGGGGGSPQPSQQGETNGDGQPRGSANGQQELPGQESPSVAD